MALWTRLAVMTCDTLRLLSSRVSVAQIARFTKLTLRTGKESRVESSLAHITTIGLTYDRIVFNKRAGGTKLSRLSACFTYLSALARDWLLGSSRAVEVGRTLGLLVVCACVTVETTVDSQIDRSSLGTISAVVASKRLIRSIWAVVAERTDAAVELRLATRHVVECSSRTSDGLSTGSWAEIAGWTRELLYVSDVLLVAKEALFTDRALSPRIQLVFV